MDPADDAVEQHYDEIAEGWSDVIDSPGRKHILWPAVRDLLPDVAGKRVLDAGCGDGHYSAWLTEQGATVVGIDASRGMVETARARHGDRIEFQRADLAEPLPFDDDSFDVVLCQHVLSHLPDIDTPLREFARILEPGGVLVLSTHHPLRDYLVVRDRDQPDTTDLDLDPTIRADTETPDYHATERFEVHWGGDDEHPGVYYRRPLKAIIDPLFAAGFSLEALEEPGPDAEFERRHPDVADTLAEWPPGALCLRAVR